MSSALARLGLVGLSLAAVACGEAGAATDLEWVTVTRGDLAFEVDVTGTLTAAKSAFVGPPSASEERDFKISRMVAEGTSVKKGDKVIWFDVGDLARELLERRAERDSAAREIERKRNEIELSRRDAELRVTEAKAAAEKAGLRADLPEKYTAAVEVKLARIDVQAANAELKMAEQRLRHIHALGQSELAYLRDRHARFSGRVNRIESTIESMAVAAPLDGVVVYRTNWRGEKKKVGDPCWVGEPCLSVTDVRDIRATGEVDEVESANVAVGQRVRLRLEALPELEWIGRVAGLRPNVYRQSPRNPLKVIGVELTLDSIDPTRMRPGMSFRGRLETARLTDRTKVPVNAVFARAEGPVVFRKTATGFAKVKVELGARTRTEVEVKAGLSPNDRVSLQDPEEGGRL
ncbi:MAG TPA: efflux RND transporter periplasmic adaptor subunit [Polyangia bacterium]